MPLRQNAGSSPQVTFTSDFHELVQGDLIPGPCTLRYDPLRLVALGDAATERHVIRAHVRFQPMGKEWQDGMELLPGQPLAELADVAGQGFMVSTTFTIPEGCDELEIWFCCTHPDGQTHWDSDFGKNFWLRFGLADLSIETAHVKVGSAAQDGLHFQLTARAAVDSLQVRWWLTNVPSFPRQTTPLSVSSTSGNRRSWSTPPSGIPVPKGATVAFDFVYRVGGRDFTDDNQGRWYVAD